MNATIHLLLGPAGSGKTTRLRERFLARSTAEPGSVLWLAPTRRAADALRLSLLGTRPTLLGLPLLTFEDFAATLIRANDPLARPLSNVQRRLLADEVIAELHLRGRLSHFSSVVDTRGFAAGVFDLLKELKRQEIWPGQLARAAYRRGYRGANVERTAGGYDISAKERQCVRLYARYQQHLTRHRLFDLEGRLWYARDLLRRGRRRPFESLRAVFVDGFTDFTRTQHDILTLLAGFVEELWVALPDEPGDLRAELFAPARATRERFPQAVVEWVDGEEGQMRDGPDERETRADAVSRSHAQPYEDVPRPAGLRHVERQLFRPVQSVERSGDADGLFLIEAPGQVGEVRLAAREIKALLRQGTPAEEVLVVVRDLTPYADLVREVFAEYGIPLDVEGAEPLGRNPAVATLLRAARVPEEGWSFAALTALLRSNYFRPGWDETQVEPDVPLRTEALLRLLGEPRGREAYLRAVDRWADRVPEGPTDEQAEVSRRLRIHKLSLACRPFLRRLLRAWDDAPARAPLADHLAWLNRFADDIGLTKVANEDERDRQALRRFLEELDAWERLSRRLHAGPTMIDRAHFFRVLGSAAAEAGLARTPRGPGRVRLLSAELARVLSADVVFLLGLGEGSFPQLAAAEPIFDEAERQSLKSAGLDVACLGDRLPAEILLFYGLVTRARRRLVLSYPAVDEKGQKLLPSSFLATLLDLFTDGSVPRKRQQMLVEGLDRAEPLSPAELRVRAARRLVSGGQLPAGLSREMIGQLRTAERVAHRRFVEPRFGPYDGRLRHPAILAELQARFGGERVLSPTALETYIACPFRFLLEDVLYLEPLAEPAEEIEGSDRGLVVHRALAWLHRRLRDDGVHAPTEIVDTLLLERLDQEVVDHARHASLAAEALWRLEGLRLRRKAAKYRQHWQAFLAPWAELQLRPQPHYLEKSFGMEPAEGEEPLPPLVIDAGDLAVRLGGRIDRVDIAETEHGVFFWIVDYKTGRSSNYSPTTLKRFERLQLTLYALAVERVLLAGRRARPVGLAYWLVTDEGAKVVLPGDRKHQGWFRSAEEWDKVSHTLEGWVASLVRSIRAGDFRLAPRSDTCTATCPYAQVCRIAQSRSIAKEGPLALPGE